MEIANMGILGTMKSRTEVMAEIHNNPVVYREFLNLSTDFRERFIEFCMGVRGVQMTYDPFFKRIFDAEVHPERLSGFLSQVLGRRLTVKRMLPNEHRRISDKGSLLIMDMLVEFDTGEMADVEIQKVGYLFPGQRASCYSADMVMRQYERMKSIRGKDFTYKDLQKVYTIVLMESSSKELKGIPDNYIHRGSWVFQSGLKLELLQEFYFISLDIFLGIMDNKGEEISLSELEAWLYFIGSDKAEHMYKVLKRYPWFGEMYAEIKEFRNHPEEAIGMFSDALRILDENTTRYMIDEFMQELEEQKSLLEETHSTLVKTQNMLDEKQNMLVKTQSMLDEKQSMLDEKQSMLDEKQSTLVKTQSMLDEKQSTLVKTQNMLDEKQSILDKQNGLLNEKQNLIEEQNNLIAELQRKLAAIK